MWIDIPQEQHDSSKFYTNNIIQFMMASFILKDEIKRSHLIKYYQNMEFQSLCPLWWWFYQHPQFAKIPVHTYRHTAEDRHKPPAPSKSPRGCWKALCPQQTHVPADIPGVAPRSVEHAPDEVSEMCLVLLPHGTL